MNYILKVLGVVVLGTILAVLLFQGGSFVLSQEETTTKVAISGPQELSETDNSILYEDLTETEQQTFRTHQGEIIGSGDPVDVVVSSTQYNSVQAIQLDGEYYEVSKTEITQIPYSTGLQLLAFLTIISSLFVGVGAAVAFGELTISMVSWALINYNITVPYLYPAFLVMLFLTGVTLSLLVLSIPLSLTVSMSETTPPSNLVTDYTDLTDQEQTQFVNQLGENPRIYDTDLLQKYEGEYIKSDGEYYSVELVPSYVDLIMRTMIMGMIGGAVGFTVDLLLSILRGRVQRNSIKPKQDTAAD
jgi:hypothetical protein